MYAAIEIVCPTAAAEHHDGLRTPRQITETIVERFHPPPGFTRVVVDPASYSAWLRQLELLPDTTRATDWQSRHVFDANEVGGVLNWRLLGAEEQCADIALRLLAEYAWDTKSSGGPSFRSLSGHEIGWKKWLTGRYTTNAAQTAIEYRDGENRRATREEYDRYLSFVMTYTNTASMSRDWPMIEEGDLGIGDVIIQPHCTGQGMGHLSVVVDACRDAAGNRKFIFVDGFTPARLPVVRQRVIGHPETVWMTSEEYLVLQQQFGPGKFHRHPGW